MESKLYKGLKFKRRATRVVKLNQILLPSREAIDTAVDNLPPDKKKRYEALRLEAERLAAENPVNHEALAAIFAESDEVLGMKWVTDGRTTRVVIEPSVSTAVEETKDMENREMLFPLQYQIGTEVQQLIDSGIDGTEAVLRVGLAHNLIKAEETEHVRSGRLSVEEKQKVLDRAQGWAQVDEIEELRSARAEEPLKASDFTEVELEKMKMLAPREYERLHH